MCFALNWKFPIKEQYTISLKIHMTLADLQDILLRIYVNYGQTI
jgi:hypothetical protein